MAYIGHIYSSLKVEYCTSFLIRWFDPFPHIILTCSCSIFSVSFMLKHCLCYYIFLNSVIISLCKAQNIQVFSSLCLFIESTFNDSVFNYRSRDSAVRKFFACHVLPYGKVFIFIFWIPYFLLLIYSLGSHLFLFQRSSFTEFIDLTSWTLKTLAVFLDGCPGQVVPANSIVLLFPCPGREKDAWNILFGM